MTVQTEPKKPAASKKKKWTLPRHRIVTNLARPIVRLLCKLRYNCDVVPFAEQGDRQYLILANHQTPFDQFYIVSAFKNAVYYVATEDLFSMGWVSDIIRFLVNPIAIRKQGGDVKAVMNCIRVAREGGTIALFPEGNRTYSGRTEHMSPAVVGLAKKLGLPIAIFRIEGGYGLEPRWSDVRRKGRMTAYVKEVIEPEEYKTMDDDAFYARITEALHVDEGCVSGTFPHKERAQYLERAVYICPNCGLATFESHEDIVECKTCGRQVRYLPTKELEGVGFDFPFRFMTEWYDWQKDFINALDTREYVDAPLYTDTVDVKEVIVFKCKKPLWNDAQMELYGDRVVIRGEETLVMPYEEVTAMSCMGRNKLNIYFGDRVFQIRGSKRFNALKYVNFCYRSKNISKGDENGKFLGL